MGERQSIAFGQEGEAAHRGRRGEGFDRARRIAARACLPAAQAIAPSCAVERVDPPPFFVGDHIEAAVDGDADDPAVVSAGQQLVAIARGDEDRASGWATARRSAPGPPTTTIVGETAALVAQADAQAALNGLFLGLGAVALLVGAVGVANIMVISVLERRSEIWASPPRLAPRRGTFVRNSSPKRSCWH